MEHNIDTTEKVQITYDEYKENPIFNYLESFLDLEQIEQDDIILIKDKLKLNKNGKIAVGGYLLFVLYKIVKFFLENSSVLYDAITTKTSFSTVGYIYYGTFLILLSFMLILVVRRSKFFKYAYTIGICSYFAFHLSYHTGLIITDDYVLLILVIYMFLSKRVKYTFIE